MITKTYKLVGIKPAPHMNPETRMESFSYDWSTPSEIRKLEFEATEDGGYLRITRSTKTECDDELEGQLSDGLFENWSIEHIDVNPVIYVAEYHYADGRIEQDDDVSDYLSDCKYFVDTEMTINERSTTPYCAKSIIYGYLIEHSSDVQAAWESYVEQHPDPHDRIADLIYREEISAE